MKVVLATSNPGKLKEIRALFAGSDYEFVNQSEYDIPEAIESGNNFAEIALLKSRHACKLIDLPAIADDSGLEVDYLEGKPGIHSARYAGEKASDAENIEKLLNAMRGVPTEKRTACFRCIIAMVERHDNHKFLITRGHWEGRIAEEPAGENGFGYDSIFYIPELGCTSAELSSEIKNKNSHRGLALRLLKEHLL